MDAKFVGERNIKFLLYEVFDIVSLTQYPYFKQHNRKIFDMVLTATLDLAKNLFLPNLKEMDRIAPELINGRVKVHHSVKNIMKECGEGGWIGSNFPTQLYGEQLPDIISYMCSFIFGAANYSASVYPHLTSGAARLITSFGNQELIQLYVPQMLAGKWQGTMALTEPQAGSSLADIVTQAQPAAEGHYNIKGHKIFISCGDHDGVENIIHLMLARIEGAASGVKGLSLFVVPKMRISNDGKLVPNDITVTQIFHKLGYRGSPICELSMGEKNDCHGYIVGEAHKGLSYMFQMMNDTRLGVGLGATSIASAAYYAALQYCKDRLQGRSASQKDPSRPQVPIIEHADIKRMLLFQRSIIEGSLSLLMQCAQYKDMQKVVSGEEKERLTLLLDFLTHIAKSYPSEMGILSVSQGLQCFGGYGYCDDFALEQYYRDVRIHPIHEGTTGIHGIGILGRQVTIKNGKAFTLYQEEVRKTIEEAGKLPELAPYAQQLTEAMENLKQVTTQLLALKKEKGNAFFIADGTLYLEFVGIITIAWQWLLQAVSIRRKLEKVGSIKEKNFYKGKYYTFQYFFGFELPKICGLAKRLMNSDGLTVEMKTDFFSD